MRARHRLQRLLDEREVVTVLGPGGVGKTTLSAALALEASRTRRTLVVTIDPAKRLASALGLELGHQVSHVTDGLDAVMVDTKQALDDLLETYAPSPDKLHTLLASPLYRQLSSALVGSEEFAAMGLLHELYTEGDYDLIVVDTPPSRHALDFLTVNQRLLRVFESGLTRFLFKPGKLFSVAGGRLTRVLAKWTSREYLETMSEFLLHFEEMFYDMEGRVHTMEDLLHDGDRTGYVLAAVPDRGSVRDAVDLSRRIVELDLSIDVAVANRVYPPLITSGEEDPERKPLLDHYARLARGHQEGIETLRESVASVAPVPSVARVVGLSGLERLTPYLVPSK